MIILNNKKLEIELFPNNESRISTNNMIILDDNIIELKFENNEDFINLLFIVNHIRSIKKECKITLKIKYYPYSRMDRTKDEFVFTLKYLCEFINSMNFNEVIVYDVHSDKTLELLNNCINISYIEDNIDRVSKLSKNGDTPLYIVIPDKGASERFKINYENLIIMNKTRDFSTGKILDIEIANKEDIKHDKFDILIIDDLCSFGGTFVKIIDVLNNNYEIGTKSLFVTHCENSIMKGDLLNEIDRVYTTNSIISDNISCHKIRVLND